MNKIKDYKLLKKIKIFQYTKSLIIFKILNKKIYFYPHKIKMLLKKFNHLLRIQALYKQLIKNLQKKA